MFKKTISIALALIAILSVISIAGFSASAEEISDTLATADEATQDEAKLVMSSEPKVDASSVNGTVIGYIGDANLDGKINIKDCTAIQKYLAKYTLLNEQAKLLSDADNNQKLNVRDATAIQKYVAGMKVESVVWHLLYETGTHVHNYVEEVVEAKCETDGYTLRSCICGEEVKENVIKAQGHDYKIKRVDATCVDEGYTLYSCKNCNYSYKDKYTDATGKHNYNKKYVCDVCGVKCSAESFEILRDFIKKNGEYVSADKYYYYYISPVVEGDVATLVYSTVDDSIGLGCSYAYEGYIDMITVFITSKGECGFYMYCQDVYESAGLLDMSKFTVNSKNVKEIEYNMFVDVDEADALANTIAYITGALATYEYNDEYSDLPVSIQELGFISFELK